MFVEEARVLPSTRWLASFKIDRTTSISSRGLPNKAKGHVGCENRTRRRIATRKIGYSQNHFIVEGAQSAHASISCFVSLIFGRILTFDLHGPHILSISRL